MNTQISKPESQNKDHSQNALKMSSETQQLMSLGEQHNWDFQIIGKAPFPEAPIRIGDWLLSPAQTDSSLIPARTLTRIQAIFAAGIRPKGFVIAHEAPKYLPSPDVSKTKEPGQIQFPTPNPNSFQSQGNINEILGFVSKAILGLISTLAAFLSIAVPLILTSGFLMGAVLIDPILIAVTEDSTWIEVDRWNLPSE